MQINFKPQYITEENKPHPLDKHIVYVPDHLKSSTSKKFYLPRLPKKYIEVTEDGNFHCNGLPIHANKTGIYANRKELEDYILSGKHEYWMFEIDGLPNKHEGYLKLLVSWGMRYGITMFEGDDDTDTRNITETKKHIYSVIDAMVTLAINGGLLRVNDPRGEDIHGLDCALPTMPGIYLGYSVDTNENLYSFYNQLTEEEFYIPRFNFLED